MKRIKQIGSSNRTLKSFDYFCSSFIHLAPSKRNNETVSIRARLSGCVCMCVCADRTITMNPRVPFSVHPVQNPGVDSLCYFSIVFTPVRPSGVSRTVAWVPFPVLCAARFSVSAFLLAPRILLECMGKKSKSTH